MGKDKVIKNLIFWKITSSIRYLDKPTTSLIRSKGSVVQLKCLDHSAAHLIGCVPKFDCVDGYKGKVIHWLPVKQWIEYKVAALVCIYCLICLKCVRDLLNRCNMHKKKQADIWTIYQLTKHSLNTLGRQRNLCIWLSIHFLNWKLIDQQIFCWQTTGRTTTSSPHVLSIGSWLKTSCACSNISTHNNTYQLPSGYRRVSHIFGGNHLVSECRWLQHSEDNLWQLKQINSNRFSKHIHSKQTKQSSLIQNMCTYNVYIYIHTQIYTC